MSNFMTVQKLVDGQKNVVIKVDGVVDTSDIAATGQIGASGFTTTIGSPNITFVAGALVPTLGQYVTFSDGTTTFPANTYITAITDATHIVVSNNALATNAAAAITITGTAGVVVLLDPAKLSDVIDISHTKATLLRVDKIIYDVEDLLSVNLSYESTSSPLIWHLVGRGKLEFDRKFGGLQSNAGSGGTGRIVLATQGWSASGVLSFSFLIECTKQFVSNVG
jgi:hypothetical protein